MPQHDDHWIQTAAEFLIITKQGWGDRQPTEQQQAIFEAYHFNQDETLLRAVVEAGLLVQQTPEEIAAKWRLPQLLVTAYAALFFDVRGHEGRHAWAYASQFGHLASQSFKRGLARAIRTIAFYNGADVFEKALDVVFRLDGQFMSDGLPSRESPNWEIEFEIRVRLATEMLLPVGRMFKLLSDANAAMLERFVTDRFSEEGIKVLYDVLAAVKLPSDLRKKINQLHLSRTMPSDASLAPPTEGAPRTPKARKSRRRTSRLKEPA